MKTTSALFFLLAMMICGITEATAQVNDLTKEQLRMQQESRPYLDSLIIEEPKTGEPDMSLFRLEALFPVKPFTRFGTNTGEFTAFTPDNPKLKGLVTEPLPLLGGACISLVYSFIDKNDNHLPIAWKYRFESVRQKGEAEENMAYQSLYLTLLNDLPFSRINVGLMDVSILPPIEEGQRINILPTLGYRFMSFSKTHDNEYMLSYLLKTREGIYSPINREEGSDRTFPEYIGGSAAQYWFIRQNMEYPEEAIKKEVSGTVLVSCTIEPDGSVTNPHVFLGSEPLLNDEAIRLVALTSGKWIPATRNGENIPDEKVIPISFNLDDKEGVIVPVNSKPAKDKSSKAYLIYLIIAAAVIFDLVRKYRKKHRRPDPALRPSTSVSNDKIVIVAGIGKAQMELMLRSFAKIYNANTYKAIIRMHPMGKHVFALTFPYDMSWIVFIEMIDHLIYFDQSEYKVQIRAWLTIPDQLGEVSGQYVMLYEAEDSDDDDNDYTSTYLTTRNNRGWAFDYETEQMKEAKVREEFAEPPFTYYDIMRVGYTEID